MKALRSQNYYEILGIPRSASAEEIRRAYELSKVTFQENSLATYSLFTDEENQEILGLISRAYETLFNPRLRREYDDFLAGLNDSHEEIELPGREFRPSREEPRAMSAEPFRSQQVPPQPPQPAQGLQAGLNAAPDPAQPPRPPQPARNDRNDKAAEKFLESVKVFDGPALKKIRQLRGLSLEDVAERTKIRKTYIQYMEEEEFTFLPAAIYVKGFVTLIAKMLELPVERVADDYMKTYRNQL